MTSPVSVRVREGSDLREPASQRETPLLGALEVT